MSETPPTSPAKRIFQATLFLLGAAIALTLAIDLMAQIWPWLLLGSIGVAAIWIAIWWHRRQRDRW